MRGGSEPALISGFSPTAQGCSSVAGPFPSIQDNISFYATIGLCLPFIAVLTMLICHKYKKVKAKVKKKKKKKAITVSRIWRTPCG